MLILNLNQIALLTTGLIILPIPAIFLFRIYYRTRLLDYLIFASYFVSASIAVISNVIADITN